MLADRLCLLTMCRPPRSLQDLLHPVLQLCTRRDGLEGQGGQNVEGGWGDQAELAGPVPQNHCGMHHRLLHREGQGERGPRPARTHSRQRWRNYLWPKFIVKVLLRRSSREKLCGYSLQLGWDAKKIYLWARIIILLAQRWIILIR